MEYNGGSRELLFQIAQAQTFDIIKSLQYPKILDIMFYLNCI